jgi:hypothetical protein
MNCAVIRRLMPDLDLRRVERSAAYSRLLSRKMFVRDEERKGVGICSREITRIVTARQFAAQEIVKSAHIKALCQM